jgi:hypothetical protein
MKEDRTRCIACMRTCMYLYELIILCKNDDSCLFT